MTLGHAKGRRVARVSDVWAFGWVLFESLVGRALFDGESSSEVLGRVLETEPDWNALPVETPPDIRKLVQRCLKKDPNLRLQHIGDARIEIQEAKSATPAYGKPAQIVRQPRKRLAWGLIAVLAVALAAALLVRYPSSIDVERRLDVWTGESADPAGFAVSPDGRQLVYVAWGSAGSQLWLRPLGADRAMPL